MPRIQQPVDPGRQAAYDKEIAEKQTLVAELRAQGLQPVGRDAAGVLVTEPIPGPNTAGRSCSGSALCQDQNEKTLAGGGDPCDRCRRLQNSDLDIDPA